MDLFSTRHPSKMPLYVDDVNQSQSKAASLVFKDVCVTLSKNEILKKVSGVARVGQILSIMGPSGAGKSTLLNALTGRVAPTSGFIILDGQTVTRQLRRKISYVRQHDVFYANLTIEETLTFNSLLRLPDKMPKESKLRRVNEIINGLELTRSMHTRMGRLSGGERKCSSIACELLTNPALLILDEPTTGLDSAIANSLMSTLTNYSRRENKTVVTTIHQPSSQIFHMFNDVLLLHDGEVAYFGKGSGVMEFFSKIGRHCEPHYNPADFILEQVKAGPEVVKRIIAAANSLRESDDWPEELKENLSSFDDNVNHLKQRRSMKTNEMITSSSSSSSFHLDPQKLSQTTLNMNSLQGNETEVDRYVIPDAKWQTGFLTQYSVLTRRSFVRSRGRYLSKSVIFQIIFVAAFHGLEWFQTPRIESSARDLLGALYFTCSLFGFFPLLYSAFSVIDDGGVFMRERSAGIYRLSAYYLATVTTEMPLILSLCIVYGTIVYWMIGLTPEPLNFFIFLIVQILHAFTSQSIGMLLGTLITSHDLTITFVQSFFVGSLLSGGFYNTHIPDWFTWMSYLSYISYTYSAFATIEFQYGEPLKCNPPDSTIYPDPCAINGTDGYFPGSLVLGSENLNLYPIYCSVLVLLGITIFARISGYFVLRYHRRPKT